MRKLQLLAITNRSWHPFSIIIQLLRRLKPHLLFTLVWSTLFFITKHNQYALALWFGDEGFLLSRWTSGAPHQNLPLAVRILRENTTLVPGEWPIRCIYSLVYVEQRTVHLISIVCILCSPELKAWELVLQKNFHVFRSGITICKQSSLWVLLFAYSLICKLKHRSFSGTSFTLSMLSSGDEVDRRPSCYFSEIVSQM